MIEVVLLIFLSIYIIFSWWFVATLLDSSDASIIDIILSLILILVAAPLITPIVLGIKVGLFVKNK